MSVLTRTLFDILSEAATNIDPTEAINSEDGDGILALDDGGNAACGGVVGGVIGLGLGRLVG